MSMLGVSLVLALTSLLQAWAMEVPVVEDFKSDEFAGKWYGVVAASNCTEFMKMKSSIKMKMPVSIFHSLENGDMSVDFIFVGPNGCLKKDMHYKMITPGHYTRSTPAQSDIRIVKADYANDAIEYSRRVSESGEISMMVKMFSRNQDIHPSCYEAFKMVAAAVGLTDDNQVIMEKDVECIPENM